MISVLSGVLFAGAVFPLVGGLGLAARAGADSFTQLPDVLVGEELPLPMRSRILAADGSQIATVYFNENRIVVGLAKIPSVMQRAIIAIEDIRFYQHDGVDFRGLLRALVRNQQEGTVTQGGSTLTQQYVKNVLIESASDESGRRAATERTTTRKLREARYALALEKRYSKDTILEKYLNIAYFGQGVYGVGTAAQHYFGKDLTKLTLDEAALLAGMVKNPSRYDPVKRPKDAKARRDLVLSVMREQQFITPAEEAAARAKPVKPVKSTLVNDCSLASAPFFCAYVRDAIINDDRFTGGASRTQRIAQLYQGGLTIRTTLDPRIQAGAQRAVTSVLRPTDVSRAAAVATIVEPGTGYVRAIASNQKFGEGPGETQVNHALGGSTGMQPGSTYKTFFLASAIQQGIPLNLTMPGPARYTSRKFKTASGAPYSISNYGGGFGPLDLPRATWNSVNTYYLQLAERTGLSKPNELARKMGLTQFPVNEFPSSVLGTANVSPLQITEAYATLAARGVHCPAIGITEIRDSTNTLVFEDKPENRCDRVLEQEDADTVNSVLQGVITNGTARSAAIGRPAAGKTGTSQSNSTAWFIGYTPQLAGAIYMGHPKEPQKFPLKGFAGAPRGVTGGSFPATMWQRMMAVAHQGVPTKSFAQPPARAVTGDTVAVPDVRGFTPQHAVAALEAVGFVGVVDPTRRATGTGVDAGLVGLTAPGGGVLLSPGSTVVLYLSDGSDQPPPSPTPTVSATTAPSPTTGPTGQPSPAPSSSCHPNKKNCQSPSPGPSTSASEQPPG